jgi:hypothetical protein
MTLTPFLHFVIISPLKRTWQFIWTIHNNDLYQVWLKLACWFWRRFVKIFSAFLLFCYYLPLEKDTTLHLNNLESPPPKDDLCQVCLVSFCLLFYVPLKNFSLILGRHHCWWRAAKFRPMLGAQGLLAGRDLYRATPTATRDLGFSGLIQSIQLPLTTH